MRRDASQASRAPARRRLAWIVAAIVLIGLVWYGFDVRYQSSLAVLRASVTMPPAPAPAAADRVLVIAPHPDDESLGAGGFLHEAVRQGAAAYVAFVTSGDSYVESADLEFHTLLPGPRQFVEYGTRRQAEARAAARALGLPLGHVFFLGFPDRGTDRLWRDHWTCDRPLTSFYTKADRSPYPDTFRGAVPYCGEALLESLGRVLATVRPTRLLFTAPADAHRDHWGAAAFALTAVEAARLRGEAWAADARLETFVIHQGAWPRPLGDFPQLDLLPPSTLADVGIPWARRDLDDESRDAKRAAIQAYHSQTMLLSNFLLAFVRRNELQAEAGARPLAAVPAGRLTVDGDLADWAGLEPAVQVPPPILLAAHLERGEDLSRVWAAADPETLYVAVETEAGVWHEASYWIRMRLLRPDGAVARADVVVRGGRGAAQRVDATSVSPRVTAAAGRRAVEVAIPRADLGPVAAFTLEAEGRMVPPGDRSPVALFRMP